MRIFRKQTARTPLGTVLLVLLLMLSIAASSIGFTAWTGTQEQIRTLEDRFTTIAIPKEQEIDRYELGGTAYEDGSIEWGDGKWYYPPSVVEEKSAQLSQVLTIDRRCLLGAQVKGIPSLTSGRLDILQYNEALDSYAYNLCILAVKCTSCDVYTQPGYRDEKTTSWGTVSYSANFEIIDVVSQNDAYRSRIGQKIAYSCTIVNKDGSVPFEAEKTYLIRGFFEDYPIVEVIDEEKTNSDTGFAYIHIPANESERKDWYGFLTMNALPEYFTLYTRPGSEDNGLAHFLSEDYESEDLMGYDILPEDSLPLYTEYTGDWQDFLNSPEGQVWQDEIIPMCEINYESATVMLTDNLQSLYSFNVGDAGILEGESFTQAQFQNGDPVCLISAAYAKANDLAVGDSITLDFYNSGYSIENANIYGVFDVSESTTICRYPLIPETRIGFEQEYNIIGIYTAPEFSPGTHSFHADTIFAPKASVPNAAQYEDPTTPILNTLILENGSADQFEAAISEQGYGDYYLYFDQNYAQAAEALQALNANAQRLLFVGVILFALASLVFLLLFARRTHAAARAMRLLGIPRHKVWRELTQNLILLELLAIISGTILSVVLFERVTAQFLSDRLAISIEKTLLCSGLQFCILAFFGGIWMLCMASRNLMQSITKGGWQWKKSRSVGPSRA